MKPFSLKFFQLKNLFLPLIIVNIFLGLGYGQKQIVASDYERAVLYLPTNYNKKKQSPNQFDNSLILKRVNELGNYYDGTYSDHLGLAK